MALIFNSQFPAPLCEKGYQQAKEASEKAYSPYSQLNVGAAFLFRDKNKQELWALGCNVENASFGATICAERMALGQWVMTAPQPVPEVSPQALFLYSTFGGAAIPPCGMCLQVMSEFVSSDFPVFLGTPKGLEKKVLFKDLFPSPFDSSSLPEL